MKSMPLQPPECSCPSALKGIHQRRHSLAGALFLALMLILTAGTGCRPKDNLDIKITDDAKVIYNSGLKHLAAAEYRQAELEFFRIIDPDPDANSTFYLDAIMRQEPLLADQARFGYVVSHVLAEINDAVTSASTVIGMILPLLGGSGGAAPHFTPQTLATLLTSPEFRAQASSRGIETVLDDLLADVRDFIDEALKDLAEVKKNPDFQMTIKELPIKFANIRVMELGGEYDLGEVYFMLSIGSIATSVLDGVHAVDLNIDFIGVLPKLISYVSNEMPDNAFDLEQIPNSLMNLGAILMHLSPNLLGVQDRALIKQGADEMADSSGYFAKMISELKRDYEADKDQANDLIGYELDSENDQEFMVFHYKIDLALPGISLNDFEDLKVEIRSDVMTAVDNIEKAFRGTGEGRLEWARDMVPLISLAVVTVLRTGALNGIIMAAAGEKGGGGTDSNPILDIINSPIITVDLVSGIITEFIPDVFRLNVKAYVETPKGGIRALMPMWTVPQDNTVDGSLITKVIITPDVEVKVSAFHPFKEMRFIYEYECGTDHLADSTFVCTAKELRDQEVLTEVTMPTYLLPEQVVTDSILEPYGTAATYTINNQVYFMPDLTTQVTKLELSENYTVAKVWQNVYDRNNFLKEHQTSNDDYVSSISDGTYWGLPPDGLKSYLPYIAFQDASMGGLLEYNFAVAESGLDSQAKTALGNQGLIGEWTNASTPKMKLSMALNAMIAMVGAKIFDLIGSL